MKIIRIYNNNVVVSLGENNEEMIVIGRGIAFQKRPNDEIDETKIEKTFILHNEQLMKRINMLMKDIPEIYLIIAEEIVSMFHEQSDLKFNDEIYLSLMDHIFLFRTREKEGQSISNPLLFDIRQIYRKEFELAKKAGRIVENKLGDVIVTDDEVGFLTLHIVNATMSQDMNTTMKATRTIYGILEIIRNSLDLSFSEDSYIYQRLVRHLQFFSNRVLSETQEKENNYISFGIKKIKKIEDCIDEIDNYISKEFGKKVSKAENDYLRYHLYLFNK